MTEMKKLSRYSVSVPDALLARAREIAQPHGGQALLLEASGISDPTLRTLLHTGKARMDVLRKLEAGVQKINEALKAEKP